jgi:replicative DNA helicase
MSLDISLLQIMKARKEYERLIKGVNARGIDEKTKIILADFGKYFEQCPDASSVPVTGEFLTYFFTVLHPKITDEQKPVYEQIFSRVAESPSQNGRDLIVHKLIEVDTAVKLSDVVDKYTQGEDIDLATAAQKIIDNHIADVDRKVKIPFVPMSEEIFDDDVHNVGFKWRWDCLNDVMRPLRGGDFIVLAARPDKGKSTAIADNLSFMAKQIPVVYPRDKYPEHRYILWLNNEGPGKRILKRVIQSALGLPMSQIVDLEKQGKLWDMYKQAIGIDMHAIKVLDIHGYKSWQVEEIFKQCKPAICVFDMIDNVHFSGDMLNGGSRTDQMLEAQYQWARELAVKHDAVMIATSQISAEGEGMLYPGLSMLKDSKTGKQGAADAIITIGASSDSNDFNRYIGLTKNKLRIEGMPQSPKQIMYLDGPCGRFIAPSKEAA